MANTSADATASRLAAILAYGNNSGSVNLYMAHGGTNFGFWAGANSQSVPAKRPLEPAQQSDELVSAADEKLWTVFQAKGWVQRSLTSENALALPGAGGKGDEVAAASVPSDRLLYFPHITSYDYDCPIGEAGTTGKQIITVHMSMVCLICRHDGIRRMSKSQPEMPLPMPDEPTNRCNLSVGLCKILTSLRSCSL